MSMEWEIPEASEPSGGGGRRTVVAASLALAVLLAVVVGFFALRGGEEPATGFGSGLGDGGLPAPGAPSDTPSTDTATTEDLETDVASASATERPAGEPVSPEASFDESSLTFDPSFVTGIAAAMSNQIFPEGEADDVILARDAPSGDALAAGALVGLFDTTLLLTDSDELSPITAAEIARLGDPRVHILGGGEAVSPEIETQLVEAGHNVHRHSGPLQAHTATNIASNHFPDARTAVLMQAPDREAGPITAIAESLAGTSLAAAQALPVILTESDVLSQPTDAYLQDSEIRQVIVVGDEVGISPAVTSRLRELGIDWLRWAGSDRFSTAVTVAKNRGFQRLDDADVVILVEGGHDSVWPAGFLGTVVAAQQNGPVLLTNGPELPPATQDYLASASPGSVEIECTPGVTRQACAAAQQLVREPAG